MKSGAKGRILRYIFNRNDQPGRYIAHAKALEKLGQRNKAIEELETAYSLNPTTVILRHMLELYENNNDTDNVAYTKKRIEELQAARAAKAEQEKKTADAKRNAKRHARAAAKSAKQDARAQKLAARQNAKAAKASAKSAKASAKTKTRPTKNLRSAKITKGGVSKTKLGK